jgi:hypothetical protein
MFPSARVTEEAESQDYLYAVEQVELKVDEVAKKVARNLTVNIPPDESP